ncbi:sulfotransferase family protein [Aliiglaciecola sp.]|nr:sulfotransferase family protein [Aliiglaciecola sp.]
MKNIAIKVLPQRLYLEYRYWDYKITNKRGHESKQKLRRNIDDREYSYRPFDENNAIFVHVPKCAGVSIAKTLFGCLAGGHTTLDEYITVFEPCNLTNYFKFTIVRNPWDRLVSAYFFLKKGGFGKKDRAWFERELSAYNSFDDFVKNWLSKDNIQKWHHFRPQYQYILNKHGKIKLDFVGFLENIDQDFDIIKNQIGLEVNLNESNKSTHNKYIDYYNEETKDIVAKVYAEDISLLGYNFDNSSLQKQILARNLK